MNLSQTSIFVSLGSGRMAAVLRDAEADEYWYQVVKLDITGITNYQIKTEQCVGPFNTFEKINTEIDKLKEIK